MASTVCEDLNQTEQTCPAIGTRSKALTVQGEPAPRDESAVNPQLKGQGGK